MGFRCYGGLVSGLDDEKIVFYWVNMWYVAIITTPTCRW